MLVTAPSNDLVVPAEVIATVRDTMGAFFEPISRIDRNTAARDFLDTAKSRKRAALLERYAPLQGKKVLEIGSGFGTNLAVWIARYAIDGYGVEPSSQGFDSGYEASKVLLAANRIDPARVVDAAGEDLPFSDGSFDIVYSANVLEHTQNPERVLAEAMRVLRSGGTLFMEMPNHLSYFEGHYMLLQPPLVHRSILAHWVALFGRDPAFAKTIQTQINPVWCRRVLRRISQCYPLELLSLGEHEFLERLAAPFAFEAQGVSGRLFKIITLVQALNRWNWIGRAIVLARGHFPLYLVVRRA